MLSRRKPNTIEDAVHVLIPNNSSGSGGSSLGAGSFIPSSSSLSSIVGSRRGSTTSSLGNGNGNGNGNGTDTPETSGTPTNHGSPSSSLVSHAINTLLNAESALLNVTTPSQQADLASYLLTRLESVPSETKLFGKLKSIISSTQSRPELELLRNLSRLPNQGLAQPDSLRILTRFIENGASGGATRDSMGSNWSDTSSMSSVSSVNTVPVIDADTDMAMRTLNNILMLQPSMRTKFSSDLPLSTNAGAGASAVTAAAGLPADFNSARRGSTTTTASSDDHNSIRSIHSNGARATARLLRAVSPKAIERPTAVFLACRLLFFSTLFENPFVIEAVETEHFAESFAKTVVSLLIQLNPESTQALTELLKLAFNITLYYPRLRPERANQWKSANTAPVIPDTLSNSQDTAPTSQQATAGEAWAQEMNGLASPTVQLFLALPFHVSSKNNARSPLDAPMQQTIALMLNIPTAPMLTYAGSFNPNPMRPISTYSLPSTPQGFQQQQQQQQQQSHSGQESKIVYKLFNLLAYALHRFFPHPTEPIDRTSRGSEPNDYLRYTVGDMDTEAVINHAKIQAARDKMGVGKDDSPGSSNGGGGGGGGSVVNGSSSHSSPTGGSGSGGGGGINGSSSAAAASKQEMGDPEIGLVPLVLLARKYVTEDVGMVHARNTARQTFRNALFPYDLDRTTAPSKQPTLTGLLIRLMSASMLPRLARASGELLLAVANGSSKELTELVGYGPAAGFLSLLGGGNIPAAPASVVTTGGGRRQGSISGASGGGPGGAAAAILRPIDPITGRFADAAEAEADGADEEPEMTPAEREAEADKLMDLFDRLNRTGVMRATNPARDPATRAKVEEVVDEEERVEREEEERRDEEEAMRDLEAYRRRKNQHKDSSTTVVTVTNDGPAGKDSSGAASGGEQDQRKSATADSQQTASTGKQVEPTVPATPTVQSGA